MKSVVPVLVLSVATTSLAATDFERFSKQVGKYAVSLGGQPRGLCLCRDTTSIGHGVGYLLRGSNTPTASSDVMIQLSCFVPVFNETSGALGSTLVCQDFVPLGK